MKEHIPHERYLQAKEVVDKYETRQKELEGLRQLLDDEIENNFIDAGFIFSEEHGTVAFTGVLEKDNTVSMSLVQFESDEVFEEVIGKLICVYKVLEKDTSFIKSFVEFSLNARY